MKYIPILTASALAISCSALPKQYSKSPSRGLVRGESTATSSVLIRTVDDGEMLWRGANRLGNEVWLDPGSHKVAVMCVAQRPWGSVMGGTEAYVKVDQGGEYLIKTKPGKKSDKKPTVEVIKISN